MYITRRDTTLAGARLNQMAFLAMALPGYTHRCLLRITSSEPLRSCKDWWQL